MLHLIYQIISTVVSIELQNQRKMNLKSLQSRPKMGFKTSPKAPFKMTTSENRKHCKTAAGSSKSAIRRSQNLVRIRRVFHVSHDYKQLVRNDNGRWRFPSSAAARMEPPPDGYITSRTNISSLIGTTTDASAFRHPPRPHRNCNPTGLSRLACYII